MTGVDGGHQRLLGTGRDHVSRFTSAGPRAHAAGPCPAAGLPRWSGWGQPPCRTGGSAPPATIGAPRAALAGAPTARDRHPRMLAILGGLRRRVRVGDGDALLVALDAHDRRGAGARVGDDRRARARAPAVVARPGAGRRVDSTDLAWLVVGGVGNAGGLLLVYRGLRVGKVGVVAPIASTEGAIAALVAILAGESLSAGVGVALVVIVAGIVADARPGEDDADDGPDGRRATRAPRRCAGSARRWRSGSASTASGASAATSRSAWILLPARLAGVVAVALPLLAARRLVLTRAAAPFVVAGGVCEVLGFAPTPSARSTGSRSPRCSRRSSRRSPPSARS